jgi:2-amino-4-hydroxy-6-hydroxymethyldihydropteridine diphosphokinase
LQRALDALIDSGALTDVVASSIYETDPIGGPEQGPYLNAVVRGLTNIDPAELLAHAHRIEDQLGRVRTVHWGPRTVDIDVVAYGQEVLATDDLTIPHPRAHERTFVLMPWNEIDSYAEIPGLGSVSTCLAALPLEGIEAYAHSRLIVKAG